MVLMRQARVCEVVIKLRLLQVFQIVMLRTCLLEQAGQECTGNY